MSRRGSHSIIRMRGVCVCVCICRESSRAAARNECRRLATAQPLSGASQLFLGYTTTYTIYFRLRRDLVVLRLMRLAHPHVLAHLARDL